MNTCAVILTIVMAITIGDGETPQQLPVTVEVVACIEAEPAPAARPVEARQGHGQVRQWIMDNGQWITGIERAAGGAY